jgi:hypothetical protein
VVSLRFARAGKAPKQRIALLSVFVTATSLSMVVAPYASASSAEGQAGYWLASSSGVVSAYGGAEHLGSLSAQGSSPVVGIAPTPDAGGYWLATASGQVYGFGDAKVFGSLAAKHLAKPVVGIKSTSDGRGYWLLGGDGGVYAFGDATYYGSAAQDHLGSPVVGMAVAPAGRGYWLATGTGTVVRFGNVPFGPAKLAASLGSAVVGMAATPDAKGYWLVTAKGKVLAYGDAHSYGSMAPAHVNANIVGIAPTADGKGYWLASRDGGVFAFGDAQLMGGPPPGQVVGQKALVWVSGIALSSHSQLPLTSAGPGPKSCTAPVWSTSDAEGTDNLDPGNTEYWWMDNDAWSSGAGPQTLYVCNQSSWYAVSDQPNKQGQVETYPNTEFDVGGRAHGVPTKPISAYNSITSTFSENFPSAGSWDAAYDLWLNNWGTEIMIWNQWTGTQLYWPSVKSDTVTLDGVRYWYQKLGTENIFFRQKMVQSGSVDILAALNWLVSQGVVKSTDVPSQLEYGVEICSTNGAETFPLTDLTFNLS